MQNPTTQKGFLLRILLLVVALISIAAVMVLATQSGLSAAATDGQTNQRFFKQFVVAGGPIVWFILLPMSLVTVYLAADYCLTIRRSKLVPQRIGQTCLTTIRQFGFTEFPKRMAHSKDLVTVAVAKTTSDIRGDWDHKREILAESLQEQASALLRRIEWLNLIGNVSPMVGLFGTVFAMIKLFNAIVATGGQPQLVRLADGISIALVTTFWGLFIAIPALAVHGIFRNRIEAIVSDAVTQIEAIMPELRRRIESRPAPLRKEATEHGIRELMHKPARSTDETLPLR
jgi:biopolymer transport protein ExbB